MTAQVWLSRRVENEMSPRPLFEILWLRFRFLVAIVEHEMVVSQDKSKHMKPIVTQK